MLIPQLLRRIRTLPQTCPTARRVLKRAPPCVACRRSGSALPPSDHTRRSLILIDAESHLDCRAATVTLTLKQWADRMGIKPDVIHGRLDRGWSKADAVLLEVEQGHYKARKTGTRRRRK